MRAGELQTQKERKTERGKKRKKELKVAIFRVGEHQVETEAAF